MRSIKVGQVYRYKCSDGETTYERVTKVRGGIGETVIIKVDNPELFMVGEEYRIELDELPIYELVLDFNDYYEAI